MLSYNVQFKTTLNRFPLRNGLGPKQLQLCSTLYNSRDRNQSCFVITSIGSYLSVLPVLKSISTFCLAKIIFFNFRTYQVEKILKINIEFVSMIVHLKAFKINNILYQVLLKKIFLKMLGLYLYTLTIGHKSCNTLSILNKLTL